MRTLSQAELAAFRGQGFVVVPDVWTAAEVTEMREAFARLAVDAAQLDGAVMHRGAQFVVDHDGGRCRIHRVVWCGAAEPSLSRYGADPRLLSLAAQVLGTRELDQLINQAHFKRPGDGVAFPWHQDSAHRRFGTELWDDVTGRGSFVEIVTALDDSDASNGGLSFLPGSNRLGHLAPAPGVRSLDASALDISTAVTPTLHAGSCVLFGPYTVHGSGANESDRPRRLFLNGFAAAGANRRVYPGEGAGRRVVAPASSVL